MEEKRIRSGTKNLSCISFRGLWLESVISILHSSSFTYPGAKLRRNIYTTKFFRKIAYKKSLKSYNLLSIKYLHVFNYDYTLKITKNNPKVHIVHIIHIFFSNTLLFLALYSIIIINIINYYYRGWKVEKGVMFINMCTMCTVCTKWISTTNS